jgi:hypothetical protein
MGKGSVIERGLLDQGGDWEGREICELEKKQKKLLYPMERLRGLTVKRSGPGSLRSEESCSEEQEEVVEEGTPVTRPIPRSSLTESIQGPSLIMLTGRLPARSDPGTKGRHTGVSVSEVVASPPNLAKGRRGRRPRLTRVVENSFAAD